MSAGIAMEAKPRLDPKIKSRALRSLKGEIGGTIKGSKLYPPLAPFFVDLIAKSAEAVALRRRSYIVQVAAQRERDVVEALRKAGLDCYCPFEPKKVRVNRHKHREVKRAMLPGYVFPIFDEHRDHWRIIRPEFQGAGIKGVIRLFMVDMRPVPVLDEVIQRIHDKEQERAGGRCAKRPPIPINVGVLVRILEPLSLAGLFGFVTGVDQEKYQVGVEIDIFGRKVPVWLPPEQVETI